MKIYFSGSVSGKKLYEENYLAIVKALQELGYEVIYQYLFQATPEEIATKTPELTVRHERMITNWLIQSDLIVAELSYRSFGQGGRKFLMLFG